MQKQLNHQSIFVHIHHILILNWHWGLHLQFLIHNSPSEDITVTPLMLIFLIRTSVPDQHFDAERKLFPVWIQTGRNGHQSWPRRSQNLTKTGCGPSFSKRWEWLASRHTNWIRTSRKQSSAQVFFWTHILMYNCQALPWLPGLLLGLPCCRE